jgi:DNA-directed RNA polymerase delta subunit
MEHSMQKTEINLEEAIRELLTVLSEKERTIITKRFSLDNGPKETLENIGKRFSVTRERIRQIEVNALKKLQRNAVNYRMRKVGQAIESIISLSGGLCGEKKIVTETLSMLHRQSSPLNGSIIRLALSIVPDIVRSDSPKTFHRFWYKKQVVSMAEVKRITKVAYQITKKRGDLIGSEELIHKVAKQLEIGGDLYEMISSAIDLDLRFKWIEGGGWGLQEWRHINPKSIRDKALIVMRKIRKPMHFIEIANAISAEAFYDRPVTVQAVHNDLIRYPDFILIGRGMYALREWGYNPGTVADVIAALLQENGVMTKKDIVRFVQDQRDVKVGTISLCLQKEEAFVRVGRAAYEFDETKWNPAASGRGRKKKEIIEREMKNTSS